MSACHRRPGTPLLSILLCAALSGCLVGQQPVAPDSDTDGLPDELELEGWTVQVFSEPVPCGMPVPTERANTTYHVVSQVFIIDNDTDGLPDDGEFLLRADPERKDTDGDGLTDGEEWDLIQDHTFFSSSRLRAYDVDSDQDCFTDLEEINGFDIPGLGIRDSDPTTDDSDRDGWKDWYEINVTHTDPGNADTDGDGASDQLDLDPLRDIALNFILESIRLNVANATGGSQHRVTTVASLQDIDFSYSPSYVNVTQGTLTTLPPAVSAGIIDVDDLTGDPYVTITVTWVEIDTVGDFVRFYDLNPNPAGGSIVRIRVNATSGNWSQWYDAPEAGPEGRDCRVVGSDGEFRFRLAVGAVGENLSGSLCQGA